MGSIGSVGPDIAINNTATKERCHNFTVDARAAVDSQKSKPAAAHGVRASCVCGGVVWRATTSRISQFLVCNCTICRKATGCQSGIAFGAFPRAAILFDKDDTLKQLKTSNVAHRSFCSDCGACILMDYYEKHTLWMTLSLLDDDTVAQRILDEYLNATRNRKDQDGLHVYPPSNVFSENASVLRSVVHQVPMMEKFGTYVPDPCEATLERKQDGCWKEDESLTKQVGS